MNNPNLGEKPDPNTQRTMRSVYLHEVRAIPTPLELYVLWAAIWIEQGNIFHVRENSDYNVPENAGYRMTGTSFWTPTRRSSMVVPEAYGAFRLIITTMDSLMPILENKNGSRANRSGWEHGHTEIRKISIQDGLISTGSRAPSIHNNVAKIATGKNAVQNALIALNKSGFSF